MSDENDISRRGFLRGDFLKPPEKSTSEDAMPPGHDPARPIMRYARSIDDVDRATGSTQQQRTKGRRHIPVFRPPGAVDEPTFLAECTRCDECVRACPHDAIIHAPSRLREIEGTPIIDPDRQPCLLCDDLPCVSACEPDVLSRAVPVMMGTAQIRSQTCLAWNSSTCTVCSEQCPVEGAIVIEEGKPRVVEETCTGCGVCRYVCPAPENAILLMPTFSRPSKGPAS